MVAIDIQGGGSARFDFGIAKITGKAKSKRPLQMQINGFIVKHVQNKLF